MGGSWILSGVLEAGQCSNQETIPLDPAPTEKPGLTPSLVNLSGLYALTVLCSSITGAVVLRKRDICLPLFGTGPCRENAQTTAVSSVFAQAGPHTYAHTYHAAA